MTIASSFIQKSNTCIGLSIYIIPVYFGTQCELLRRFFNNINNNQCLRQGRIQDFCMGGWGGGGGGQKNAHHERQARNTSWPGSRARCGLKALEALVGFNALSCYLSLIFKHSDKKKWDTQTYSIKF